MTNYFKYHLLENVSFVFIHGEKKKKQLLLSIKLESSSLAVHLPVHIAAIEIVTCESNYCSLGGDPSSF